MSDGDRDRPHMPPPTGDRDVDVINWLRERRQEEGADVELLTAEDLVSEISETLPEDTPPETRALVEELTEEVSALRAENDRWRATSRRRFYVNIALGATSSLLGAITLELQFGLLSAIVSIVTSAVP